MAKTPDAALSFMRNIVPAATARAEREAKDIQAVIDQQKGDFKVQARDWQFYAEQVRKAKYDLDESQIKPYFELNNVLNNGVFYAANLLYGISFKERKDIPVYQPDVKVYEVFDKDGKSLALFYTDYFKRDNKGGGARMSNFVDQSKLNGTKPVIYNVANFTKPAPGQPALLSYDDVITMFHEFGHALHGMFADQEYPSLSGTNTARLRRVPVAVQRALGQRSESVQPLRQALPERRGDAAGTGRQDQEGRKVQQGLQHDRAAVRRAVGHALAHADRRPTAAGRGQVRGRIAAKDKVDLSYVPPRYRSSYFQHIWGNGYAAGYYAYLWTEMLADDAFQWFTEHGGLTAENGQRFRDMILSRGNSGIWRSCTSTGAAKSRASNRC